MAKSVSLVAWKKGDGGDFIILRPLFLKVSVAKSVSLVAWKLGGGGDFIILRPLFH